ncbi:MAG: hemolysin family protein [Porphyromonas sp.]|nr:hemolysin family protein [Porphyromonas sp.]
MIYIGIFISLILSGFFSGMEIAFVSSDKLRLEIDRKEKGVVSQILGLLFRKPDEFVTTLLVGNNAVLVIYGLLMAQLLEHPIRSYVADNDALVLLTQSLLSTLIILVTGEFLPKLLFRRKSNQMMKVFALPVSLFYIVLFPITKCCTLLTKLFFLLVGRKQNEKMGGVLPRFSTEDLDHYLSENIGEDKDGALNTEVKIIQNALEFSKVQARHCMVPRNEIVGVEYNADIAVLEEKFSTNGLSKLIVYKENIDDVMGYIHSSEMFQPEPWQSRIVPTLFVPESMFANKLMRQLMQRNRSVAIVIDELGGTSGMVTLEDIVEEIFGDIEDEHDKSNLISKKISDNTYVFSGRMEIDDINEQFNLQIPEDEEYLTIAGFILHHYQHIPSNGETVEIAPYKFDVLRSTSTKIVLVKMTVETVNGDN